MPQLPLVHVDHVYRVNKGPSKLDLQLSLFGGRTGAQPAVLFWLVGIGQVEISILEVSREDGSGESWIFKGYVHNRTDDGPEKVTGYFNTQSGIGSMKFVLDF